MIRCSCGEVEFADVFANGVTRSASGRHTLARCDVIARESVHELIGWWQGQAAEEAAALADKVVEYGGEGRALDLIDLGRMIASIGGREVNEAEAQEIGCAMYAYGKMGRIIVAIREGRRPSDDSWYDLGVYARMAQRIRAVGGWPS